MRARSELDSLESYFSAWTSGRLKRSACRGAHSCRGTRNPEISIAPPRARDSSPGYSPARTLSHLLYYSKNSSLFNLDQRIFCVSHRSSDTSLYWHQPCDDSIFGTSYSLHTQLLGRFCAGSARSLSDSGPPPSFSRIVVLLSSSLAGGRRSDPVLGWGETSVGSSCRRLPLLLLWVGLGSEVSSYVSD